MSVHAVGSDNPRRGVDDGTLSQTTCYCSGFQPRGKGMKKLTIAAAVLLTTASLASAQMNRSGGATTSRGASQLSPGHEMKNSKTNSGPGASEFSPGDRMRDQGTVDGRRGHRNCLRATA